MSDDGPAGAGSGEPDERFDTFVAREAKGYNAPSDHVPRAEMWRAIVVARSSSDGAERRAAVEVVRPRGATVAGRRSLRLGGALAATLLVGVAIGKYALARSGGEAAPGSVMATGTVAGASTPGAADSASASYGVAATAHMSRAEALLTAYETSRGAAADAQIATWAGRVLSDTRLMLDSPAARDPLNRRLLEDLEVVLVQMVQRAPPDGAGDERGHITHTLQRTQMLTRLRSAQQSGPNRGT